MLFKVLDPTFVLSETFRQWPDATKTVFTICAALANFQTGEFYHRAKKIAHHANLDATTVRKALLRIQAAGQIEILGTPRKRSFRYTFAATISAENRQRKEAGEPLNSPIEAGEPLNSPIEAGEPLNSPEIPPSTPVPSPSTELSTSPNNNRGLNNKDLTTTGPFDYNLLGKLIAQYGRDPVMRRVVVISKMNGRVKNKPALLVDSLKRNYIPTDKLLRAEEEEKERQELRRKRQEEHEARLAELDRQDQLRWEQFQEDNPDALQAALAVLAEA